MRLLYSVLMLMLCSLAAQAVEVVAVDFERGVWQTDQYNKASGTAALVGDVPAALKNSKQALQAKISFSDKGFEWFSVTPNEPLYIPGKTKRVSLWAKTSNPQFGLSVGFHNSWYQGKQDGKDLKASFNFKQANTWQRFDFQVPADWRQPIAIAGVSSHNWSTKGTAHDVEIHVDNISVETDISGLDENGQIPGWTANPKERSGEKKVHPRTPLFALSAQPSELCGVYTDQDPSFMLSIRSWYGKPVDGDLNISVRDHAGTVIHKEKRSIKFSDVFAESLDLKKGAYGQYFLDLELAFDGKSEKKSVRFAQLPTPVALTDAQRDVSPYGLNVHGGRAVLVTPFTKAGITWFRDYVFNKSHAGIARGKDGQYNGWPYYKPLIAKYKEHNVRVLGTRGGKMRGITEEMVKAGEFPALPKAWLDEFEELVNAFPYIHHWEIDNEYDLHGKDGKWGQYKELEGKCAWKNYGVNHRDFGKMMKRVTGGKKMAVENGRAGIWPDLLAQQVDSGDFDEIQVANVHHYSGIESAEVNYGNFNTGFNGKKGRLYFDNLRAAKRAAQKDGKQRELWLTEFGWDTKAGHVVSHYEQAVFLSRAYMTFLMADVDKSFWFFDIDSHKADTFFDGCGLLMDGPEHGPKLSLAAMAGLTQRLPLPKAIGQVNVGPGTHGYLFKQGDQIVASLFSLTDDKGPSFTFDAHSVYDFLGNKLDKKTVQLSLAPVFAEGIKETDPLYLQTAYSFVSDYLVYSAVGDQIELTTRVFNNRQSAINARVEIKAPKGWEHSKGHAIALPKSGASVEHKLTVRVPADAPIGEHVVYAVFTESGKVIKEIPLRVLVQDPMNLEVTGIFYRPGETEVTVKCRNVTLKPIDAQLDIQLPKSWSLAEKIIEIKQLPADETKEIKLKLNWSATWGAEEQAMVKLTTAGGFTVAKPIIPNHYTIPKANNIKLDGDLSDWPKASQWPQWMLGVDLGKSATDLRVAWSDEGLYVAYAIDNSKIISNEPHNFWNGDAVEILIDSGDKKTHRDFEKGDHQFWMVPQLDKGTPYLGQWKRKDEIAKTRYGIKTVQGSAKAFKKGYLVEAFIPAAEIAGFEPKSGVSIGFAVLFTIRGHDHARNVYWPVKKQWTVTNWPKTWGSLKLVE